MLTPEQKPGRNQRLIWSSLRVIPTISRSALLPFMTYVDQKSSTALRTSYDDCFELTPRTPYSPDFSLSSFYSWSYKKVFGEPHLRAMMAIWQNSRFLQNVLCWNICRYVYVISSFNCRLIIHKCNSIVCSKKNKYRTFLVYNIDSDIFSFLYVESTSIS